jgi:hypothetical protein
MQQTLQEVLAANEDTFRKINEGIARGQWPGEESTEVSFRCECAQLGCNRLLTMTPNDYEAVRSHSRRFVVVPGHELAELETIVDTRDGYIIVEKHGPAGRIVEELDPRG